MFLEKLLTAIRASSDGNFSFSVRSVPTGGTYSVNRNVIAIEGEFDQERFTHNIRAALVEGLTRSPKERFYSEEMEKELADLQAAVEASGNEEISERVARIRFIADRRNAASKEWREQFGRRDEG